MEEKEGKWVTIRGHRVFITKDGKIKTRNKSFQAKLNKLKLKIRKSSSEKSVDALNKIDRLANEAQHYTNDFNKEKLEKKGREVGSKDFEDYVNKLRKESYEKRNDYKQGDVIEYDTNYLGVTENWHQGEILSVENGLAGHGDTKPDKVYKVKDLETGNEYKINASAVGKRVKSGINEKIEEQYDYYKNKIGDERYRENMTKLYDSVINRNKDEKEFTEYLKKNAIANNDRNLVEKARFIYNMQRAKVLNVDVYFDNVNSQNTIEQKYGIQFMKSDTKEYGHQVYNIIGERIKIKAWAKNQYNDLDFNDIKNASDFVKELKRKLKGRK